MSLLDVDPLVIDAWLVGLGYRMAKAASDRPPDPFPLSGMLYATPEGWIMLSVPNALVRGMFDALHEPGVELPTQDGKFSAHCSVIRPEELTRIGGADKITERGQTFRWTPGVINSFRPSGWNEHERVWVLRVHSPDLKRLRRSYGLSEDPDEGQKPMHVTLAVRKHSILSRNSVTKTH